MTASRRWHLVLLADNSEQDIRASRDIVWVMQEGVRLQLDDCCARRRGEPPAPQPVE